MIYFTPTSGEALSQGDILSDCPVFGLEAVESPVDLDAAPSRWHERVIVLTQACDLANDKTSRILVGVMHAAQTLVDRGQLRAASIRDQVRRGLVYGWYFLPTASPPVEFPESIIDLHDLHTISRRVLEQLVRNGKRACRLATPYREHLAQHFAVTYMRIGLPIPVESDA